MQFQRAEDAFLPPRRAAARADLDVVALAVGGEAAVGHDRRPIERPLENQLPSRRAVAALSKNGRAAASLSRKPGEWLPPYRPKVNGFNGAIGPAYSVLAPRRRR